LNLVRGEDSLVRALWAPAPLLWQLYPQHDGAHQAKLEAFLALAGGRSAPVWAQAQRAWNGLGRLGRWPTEPLSAWLGQGQEALRAWRQVLRGQPSLADQLLAFVAQQTDKQIDQQGTPQGHQGLP
jgi:hypothetical protein